MENIIVITQNVKLPSLASLKDKLVPGEVLILSTQYVFENEVEIINNALSRKCKFIDFADLLSDEEREKCDIEAFDSSQKNVSQYYERIKELKNERIIARLKKDYPCENCLLVCDDLGVDGPIWEANGFIRVQCDYYYKPDSSSQEENKGKIKKFIKSNLNLIRCIYNGTISVAHDRGVKYLFFGNTSRIGYRIKLDLKEASKLENIKYIIELYLIRYLKWLPRNRTIRMSTFHEDTHWNLPDFPQLNVKKIQDGYLPPNYTSKYLYFYGRKVEFYTWDTIGRHTFQYHGLNSIIMPFRKKLYLPKPQFPNKVKKVLCVASGSGDWTAIKNRSDEDMMLWTFGKVAAVFPDIEFVYRCHPVWIHPQHQGINSIQRAAEYYDWLKLPNL